MESIELMVYIGKLLYEFHDNQEIYNKCVELITKYEENSEENFDCGMIAVNVLYGIFMRGYENVEVCEAMCYLMEHGLPILGIGDEVVFDDFKYAMCQYTVKKYKCSRCARYLCNAYAKGTRGRISVNPRMERLWLQKTAALGDSKAQTNLGGDLWRENRPYEAEPWLLAAAEQGNPYGMFNLGKLYSTNHYCEYTKSAEWIEKAANAGLEEAKQYLNKYFVYSQMHQKYLRKM